nr:neuraminidase-like domain-containing protein [uncultured Flavobacterium sp.]
MATKNNSINGYLLNTKKMPLSGLRIEVWDKDLLVDDFLGESVSDSNGMFSISFTQKRFKELFFDNRPDLYFKIYSNNQMIQNTEDSVLWNIEGDQKDLIITINSKIFDKNEDILYPTLNSTIQISGQIVSSLGKPLDDFVVEAYIITINKKVLVATSKTVIDGKYQLRFDTDNDTFVYDVQVHAYPQNNKTTFFPSEVKYNVKEKVSINIVVPNENIISESEFDSISQKIQSHLGNLKINQVKEDEKTQHITYLSNKTGIDARIVAMNVAANQIGNDLRIPSEHVYAMFRSGVPGNKESIQSLSPDNIKEAIENAISQQIIPKDNRIDETVKKLSSLKIDFALNSKPKYSVSTMNEMLSIRLNDEQKQIFAEVHSQVGSDSTKLWSNLTQRGFKPSTVQQLQLDGKLGFLTGHNAKLVEKIYKAYPISKEEDFVNQKLYKADKWKPVIKDDLPDGVSKDEYANYLANQIKLSYPNLVAASMIQSEEVNLGNNTPLKEVSNFFSKNNSSSNKIGIKPTNKWESFNDLSTEAKVAVKTFERLYQLSPSDESMTALSQNEIYSAYQIVKYTQSEFMSRFEKTFPSKSEALKIYTKANEIYSTSLNIATGYITQRAAPNVYAITGTLNTTQNFVLSGSSNRTLNETIAYPTLEELFGNMDYCSCDHCRSVLSPAAYFVELLQLIDLTDKPHSGENPIVALTKRRPDIENIQLSCENTNMALPYIDLVNEILEYYILNGNLDNLEGYDVTEENTQAELLAEPQFVKQSVYENELKQEVFPYNLPFHQPLETLRRIFNLWGVSLRESLHVFSRPLSARKEMLCISEDEYKTLTDLSYKKLPLYFGEPENNTIVQLNAALANGKEFSRRLGIQNEELVRLLKTNFINPGYSLTSKLQKLSVPLSVLYQFYQGNLSNAELEDEIAVNSDATDYDGNVIQWLNKYKDVILGLIKLTDVGETVTECNFAKLELRYALPDNSLNALKPIAYNKFHRFLRLVKKTQWSIETLDAVMKSLLPIESFLITESNIDQTFRILLNRIANFVLLADLLSFSQKKYPDVLLLLDVSQSNTLRQEQMAKILKMNSAEMIELALITGIDLFANDFEEDEPSLIKFIRISKQLKVNGIRTIDISYLLRHQDNTGKLAQSSEALLKNIKQIKDAINKVDKENSIADNTIDLELAKSKMLLVYDAATTDRFFGLLLSTSKNTSALATSVEELPEALRIVDLKLNFDTFKKELSYQGVLSAIQKTAIENKLNTLASSDFIPVLSPADLTTFKTDYNTALNQLFAKSNNDLNSISTTTPELKVIYDAVIVETKPDLQAQLIVNSILPELKKTLKSNAIQQVLISILKSDADLIKTLTTEVNVLHSQSDTNKNALFDFEQLEQKIIFDQNRNYSFYVDVPLTDDYIIYLKAPQNTIVNCKVNDTIIINNATIGAIGEISNSVPIALKAGVLHTITLDIVSLPATDELTVSWRTKGIEKTKIPNDVLYFMEKVDFAKNSLIRIEKAIQLQKVFKINYLELEYFASLNSETKNLLNEIPVKLGINAADLSTLWNKIDLLSYFLSIKKENELEENTWLSVLINPNLKNTQDKFLLESFNAWQEDDLVDVLDEFGFSRADLSLLTKLKKVKEAMRLINAMGYHASQSINWITNNPSFDLVSEIKSTIKGNVTESVWLESMQSVNDVVRNKLRDALVSYILQYKQPSPEIDNSDKLYEYFLIDVQMDACMKTSRIRQALSTVQLFIQRCLMNLEPTVNASSIKAEQWVWMKRYRVWEANRKVFLYPENWLEPELRDNKSSFFKELEGEMMQQEITDESAELAFLNYLKKLDDIAKLEMVGMYLEENEQGNQDDDILHIIGRTNGNTRQHYYRRYEYGYWTPWEKISLNIEGDHVFPIIWKKRLFVFWLTILEKPAPLQDKTKSPTDLSTEPISQSSRINVEINMCWGEYYKGKWTSPKSTEMNKPLILPDLETFNKKYLLMHGRKDSIEKPEGKFRERLIFDIEYLDVFIISGRGYFGYGGKFTFTSKNAPPLIEQFVHDSELQTKVANANNTSFVKVESQASLDNNRIYNYGNKFSINIDQPQNALQIEIKKGIFTKKPELTNGFTVLPLRHSIENQFEAPISYTDERTTLFSQPEEKISYVGDYEVYYPMPPIIIEEPPIIIDRPRPGWPPIDPSNPDFGGIFNDPRIVNDPITNGNINTILPNEASFQFGGIIFSMEGRITNAKNQF